jgi:hypothetical protein
LFVIDKLLDGKDPFVRAISEGDAPNWTLLATPSGYLAILLKHVLIPQTPTESSSSYTSSAVATTISPNLYWLSSVYSATSENLKAATPPTGATLCVVTNKGAAERLESIGFGGIWFINPIHQSKCFLGIFIGAKPGKPEVIEAA